MPYAFFNPKSEIRNPQFESMRCTTETWVKYPHAAADQLLALLGYAAIDQVVLSQIF
jgi:hypothetical protein